MVSLCLWLWIPGSWEHCVYVWGVEDVCLCQHSLGQLSAKLLLPEVVLLPYREPGVAGPITWPLPLGPTGFLGRIGQ